MLRKPIFAAGTALLVSGAAFAQEGSFERTLPVSAPVHLEVRTGSGSIDVRPGASDVVTVLGEIRGRRSWFGGSGAAERIRRIEENPPIQQEGSRIRIGEFEERDEDLFRNVSIRYEILVPAETSLKARSGSGSVEIGDLRGSVEAKTGSGSVRLGSIDGDVTAETGSGSIRVASVNGSLRAETGGGSIEASGVASAINASSGSGSIELEQTGAGDVRIRSGSGGIRIEGVRGALTVDSGSGSVFVSGEVVSDWLIDASSGGVTLALGPDAAFELDARTSSGRIDSDHPVTVMGRLSRKNLRGTVRGGGPRVAIETASGSIVIR